MAETQTVKIFLASSSELKEDRNAFEIFINRQNKFYHEKNIFLDLEKWEDFIDAMSQSRLQDEYNKAVRESDIFIMLFFTKVGKYTKEEFESAFGQFKESGKPLIYTYFKTALISSEVLNREDCDSLFDFKDMLKSLGHFWTTYKNTDGLQLHFKSQLDKLFDKVLVSPPLPSKQSSPPIPITPGTPDYVIGRDNLLNQIHENLTTQKDLLLVNGVGGIGKTTAALAYINHKVYQKHYSFIAWITITENMLEDIVNGLQAELKVEFRSDATMEQQLRELIVGLRQMEGKKLLVIDNANNHKQLMDLKPTLKAMECHILITSRCNPDEYAFLKVEELPKADAFSLFVYHYTGSSKTKLGKEQKGLIYRLLKHINYHTLLVELLAKASRKKGLTLNQIKERLEQADHKHPDLNRNISIGIHAQMTDKQKQGKLQDYILTLFKPEQLSPESQDILRLFSILPPESIPLPHLKMMSDISPEQENDYEDQLEELFQGGWISKKRNTQYQKRIFEYKMHPLVRDVVLEKLEPNETNCQRYILLLIEILRMHLNKSRDYIAYGQSIVNHINSTHTSWIWLNFYLSDTYRAIGNLLSAQKSIEAAQKGFEIQGDKYNLSISYERLGDIHQSMGHTKKTLKFFKQFNQLLKELYIETPNNEKIKSGLAISFDKLGSIHQSMGYTSEALKFFEQFNQLQKEIYDTNPNNEITKNTLAISFERIGSLHQSLGHTQIALQFFEKYNQLTKDLYDADPSCEDFKNGLAISYEKLGDIHQTMGHKEKALQFFEEDIKLTKELYAANPNSEYIKIGLATSFDKLGDIHQTLGHTKEAMHFFKKYNQLQKELYDANPNSVDLKNSLAVSYAKLAEIDIKEMRHNSARELLNKAIAIWQQLFKETQIPESKTNIEMAQKLLNEI